MARYVDRVNELINDGYLINNRHGSEVRLTTKGVAKLHNLIHDGYLVMVKREDNVTLTTRGISVLMACADRPSRPPKKLQRIPIGKK